MDWWGDLLLLGIFSVLVGIGSAVRRIAAATDKAVADRNGEASEIKGKIERH